MSPAEPFDRVAESFHLVLGRRALVRPNLVERPPRNSPSHGSIVLSASLKVADTIEDPNKKEE